MANPNWTKGVSGNPKGRPPKGDALADMLRDMMEDVAASGRSKGRQRKELFLEACFAHAMKGDGTFAKLIWERYGGKVPDIQRFEDEDGEPLAIVSFASVKAAPKVEPKKDEVPDESGD